MIYAPLRSHATLTVVSDVVFAVVILIVVFFVLLILIFFCVVAVIVVLCHNFYTPLNNRAMHCDKYCATIKEKYTVFIVRNN